MIEILNTSIAVTAAAHNPSILHPSFLVGQEIVPGRWEMAEDPVCTPAFSIVKFLNGIVITVEGQKLQVVDNEVLTETRQSELPGVVDRYTRKLPHVRYTAVGINVTGFMATADASAILLRFVADGPWNRGDMIPESVGIRFVYPAVDTRLRLAFDTGTIQPQGAGARLGVVVSANYHVDVAPQQAATQQISAAVARFDACIAHFRSTVPLLLGAAQGAHATN